MSLFSSLYPSLSFPFPNIVAAKDGERADVHDKVTRGKILIKLDHQKP